MTESARDWLKTGSYMSPYEDIEMISDLRRVKNIEVLQNLPGFEEFYESQIKERLKVGRNIVLLVMGPSGLGKETEAGQVDALLSDPTTELNQFLANLRMGNELGFATFSPFLRTATKIPVLDPVTLEQVEWLIDPEVPHGKYNETQFARGIYLMRSSVRRFRERVINHSPSTAVVEVPGFPNISGFLPAEILWRWLRTMAADDDVLVMANAPDVNVLQESAVSRDNQAKARPEDIPQVALANNMVIDVGANLENFTHMQGTSYTIALTRGMYEKEIFRLFREGVNLTGDFIPLSLEDLQERYINHPEFLTQEFQKYHRYQLEEVLRYPRSRILNTVNMHLKTVEKEKAKRKSDKLQVHFNRGRLEAHQIPINTKAWYKNPDSKLGAALYKPRRINF